MPPLWTLPTHTLVKRSLHLKAGSVKQDWRLGERIRLATNVFSHESGIEIAKGNQPQPHSLIVGGASGLTNLVGCRENLTINREGTMIAPTEKPTVKLLGEDGNAFIILGKVMRALKDNGADDEYVRAYLEEAKDGDYDHLLQVTMDYTEVE